MLRENILLGLSDEADGDDRLARAVRCAVLERDLAGFPGGLETVTGVKGREALRRADPAHGGGADVRARTRILGF